jgi:predicted AAA+ superfamily ATPase
MERKAYLMLIERYFENHPVVALLGPRQCGKTTLANMLVSGKKGFNKENYFDLENPLDMQRLSNPVLALTPLKGLVVIDEVQRHPELFPVLRYIVDQKSSDKKFLVLGSASLDLVKRSCESLAGRIAYVELTPFALSEVEDQDKLWIRGGFPRSYLAASEEASLDWREFFIRTFLEQDIPSFGISIPAASLRRFWTMLAHYHGNIFNASEIGRSFGASDVTMKKYLDILTGTFMIRQLLPWFENIGKRQVKAPKIFFRDSGIFHSLLHIDSSSALRLHPKLGASWEGFALEEIIRFYGARAHECYFYATYSGSEIDLIIQHKGKLLGFEFKYTDKPSVTKSMRIVLSDLKLDHLYVIYPGNISFELDEKITARGIKSLLLSS